jgi:hypothetical protein
MPTIYQVYRHRYVPQMGIDEHVDTGFRVAATTRQELWDKVDAVARRNGSDNAERWFYPVITSRQVGV